MKKIHFCWLTLIPTRDVPGNQRDLTQRYDCIKPAKELTIDQLFQV